MTCAEAAYTRLQAAIEERGLPDCHGVEMFTADELTAAEREVLGGICRGCDLLALCRRYADVARPTAGFWAGRMLARDERVGWGAAVDVEKRREANRLRKRAQREREQARLVPVVL